MDLHGTMTSPLVYHEDKPHSTRFYFHLLCQVTPCMFSEVDRFGRRMGLSCGFPGLACRHCVEDGHGAGRFFPSSIKTFQDGSKTLNSIYHHVMQCRKCPVEVKDVLTDARKCHDAERNVMKFGSQQAFLTLVWGRLHQTMNIDDRRADSNKQRHDETTGGTQMIKQEQAAGSSSSRGTSGTTAGGAIIPSDVTERNVAGSNEKYIRHTIHDDMIYDDDRISTFPPTSLLSKRRTPSSCTPTPTFYAPTFQMLNGPILLATESDKEWLTPRHCYIREKCVVLFTATEQDKALRYQGRKKPVNLGQVGIRCPYCMDKTESSSSAGSSNDKCERNSVHYPKCVGFIYSATMNLLQRHFLLCSAVPASVLLEYEALKGDAAKSGTSKKYWVDSALNLGLVDTEDGIRFSPRRNVPSRTRSLERGSLSSEEEQQGKRHKK